MRLASIKVLADLYKKCGMIDEAESTLLKRLTLANHMGLDNLIIEALADLIVLYRLTGNKVSFLS